MKFVISLVVCSVLMVVIAQQQDESKTNQYVDECTKENNIDKEKLLTVFKSGNKIDKVYKCYLRCLAIKQGHLNNKDEPVYDEFIKHFKLDDAVIANMKNCSSTLNDKCEQFYEINSCATKYMDQFTKSRRDAKNKNDMETLKN